MSTEITTLLESALQRERSRLEATYRARQDALLRAVSTVLNESLERAVQTAARRETDALIQAFSKLSHAPQQPDLEITSEMTAATRESFAAAFETAVLPAFEGALAEMMRGLAGVVESEVDDKLIKPANGVIGSLETAADSIRSVKSDVADLSADSDIADAAAVQKALDDGNIREALQLCVGKSVAVQAKAVSGVLDAAVGPEEAFGGIVPPMADLVKLAAVLSMDLGDRTDARLTWLYEVVTLMDDAEEEHDAAEREGVESSKRRLEGTIQRLSEFQKNGAPGPAEAKHTKLLIRVLQAHLNAMNAT